MQADAEKAAVCAQELEERIAADVGIDHGSLENLDHRRELREQYFELAYKVKGTIVADATLRETCIQMSSYHHVQHLFPDLSDIVPRLENVAEKEAR